MRRARRNLHAGSDVYCREGFRRVPCSNRARASRQFSASALQWRRPQRRNRIREEEEEEARRDRTLGPRLQRPRRTRRLHRTPRPLLTWPPPLIRPLLLVPPPRPMPHPRRISPRRGTPPLPRRARRKRHALHRSASPILPPARLQRWRDTRRRPEPLPRSSRTSPPAMAALAAPEWRNQTSGKTWRLNPVRAALSQQHRQAGATRLRSKLHNKTWRRNNMRLSRIRRAAPPP